MTTVRTEYATLGTYLSSDQQTPSSSSTKVSVPSMSTPIIPQYTGGYGLNTLTHDADGVGYYGINKAYACSKIDTSFNVASCPSNRPLTSFIPATTRESFRPLPTYEKKS